MAEEFKLESPNVTPNGRHGGARPGAGRPAGRQNVRSEQNWQIVDEEWPDTLRGIATQARRITDPNFRFFSRHEQRLILECAFWIGAREFPEPRSAPVQIGISLDREQLITAVESGEMTPSDFGAIVRARQMLVGPDSDEGEAGEDPRKLFTDRLTRIIATRAAAPAPENEPAVAPVGFHNPPSEDQFRQELLPETRPADSIAAIRARMEAALQAPDADAIAGLADDLEALAQRLEATNGHTDSE